MTSPKNIKKLIKNAAMETNREVNEIVFNGLLEELDKAEKQDSAASQPGIRRVIMKSKIVKLAAAAVIIIVIALFVVHSRPVDWIEPPEVLEVTKSPAELTTFASLTFAYRQGGMEMVEQMCDKALQMAGQRPANISLQEFLEAINNGKSERTEL